MKSGEDGTSHLVDDGCPGPFLSGPPEAGSSKGECVSGEPVLAGTAGESIRDGRSGEWNSVLQASRSLLQIAPAAAVSVPSI